MSKKLRVLLVQGGPSSEHAVSLESGKKIYDSLNVKKYECTVVTILRNGKWKVGTQEFSQGDAFAYIEKKKFDIAFIGLHGAFGEDGRIQALFEAIKLPYTGSSPEASMLAMNKAVSGNIFTAHGLPVPAFEHITNIKQAIKVSLPWVIKPCHGGSSVDIAIVQKKTDASKAVEKITASGDTVIIQHQIKGREFTCGILENSFGKPEPLPPTEIIPIKGTFFDFKAKYESGGSKEITPPDAPPALIKKIQTAALLAHQALGCSGMSRSDFLFDGKKLYILETNTIPGMTQTSLLPQEAAANGIAFPELLDRIIDSALHKRA